MCIETACSATVLNILAEVAPQFICLVFAIKVRARATHKRAICIDPKTLAKYLIWSFEGSKRLRYRYLSRRGLAVIFQCHHNQKLSGKFPDMDYSLDSTASSAFKKICASRPMRLHQRRCSLRPVQTTECRKQNEGLRKKGKYRKSS